MRRSLVFAKKILAGEEIKSGDLIAMRPGFGISPDVYETYLGAKLLRDVEEHEFLESSQVRLR
jgi:sialic acid synthase SpsE